MDEDGKARLVRRAPAWFGSTMLLAVAACLLAGPAARAQGEPSPLRRIAPDAVPDYRGAPVAVQEAPVTMPDAGQPFGSCERKAQRVAWLSCLKATSDLTDQSLNDTAGQVQQKLDEKAGAATGRKRFLARALDQAQEQWRALRNHECQQLAAAEPALVPDAYEARLMCLIRSDLQRMADLKSRYQLTP